MSTSYIVGAGASKAVWGFPVLEGLLSTPKAALKSSSKRLYVYVSETFGKLRRVNLEDVLADLDNTLHGLGNSWFGATSHPIRRLAADCKEDLLKVLVEVFKLPLASHSKQICTYESVFGQTYHGERIITLNYDLGIEEYFQNNRPAQAKRGSAMSCALFDRPNNNLLKLHGSLDYWACSNPRCPNRHNVSRGTIGSECKKCGADSERIIVPPSMNKSFDNFPSLSPVWRLARTSLADSRRIIVWGYSCPMTDHHFAWILRSCGAAWRREEHTKREIVIINPDRKVKNRLETLLDPNGALRKDGTLLFSQFDDHAEFAESKKQEPVANPPPLSRAARRPEG